MSSLRRAATLRYLSRHPGQMVLSVLGVALGVAVVVALDLAIQSSRAAFEASTTTIAGQATHTVVGGPTGLDDSTFREIRLGLGIRSAAPVVEGYVTSPGVPGLTLRLLGVDPFSELPFRPYLGSTLAAGGVGALVADPRGAFLARETVAEARLVVGDEFILHTRQGPRTVVLAGELTGNGPLDRAGVRDLVIMDIAAAQDLLDLPGKLSRIDLILPEDAAESGLLVQLLARLPGDARLEDAGTRVATLAAMIAAFNLNLSALSLLALVFGMFLIYNTMTFSIVRRRGLIGSLRALGVTPNEVLRGVLLEALLLGSLGAVLGLIAGVLLGRGLVLLVTRTINDLYFVLNVDGLSVPPESLLKGLLLGIAATLLASLPPALEATRADVRRTLLRSTLESRTMGWVSRAAALAGGLLAVAIPLLWMSEDSLLLSFAAIFLLVLGMALLTPKATVVLIGWGIGPLRRIGGVFWAIAARSVITSLSRTGPAIAALVVSISVVVGLGSMIASFRGTLVEWLEATLQADVYVSLPSTVSARAQGSLSPDLIAALVAAPGVVGRSTYRGAEFSTDYGLLQILAVDLHSRGERAFDFLEGGGDWAFERFRAQEGAFVSEPFAYRHELGVGDDVQMSTPGGVRAFPVVGVYYDYRSERGTVMISRDTYDRYWDDPGITSMGLFLDENIDVEATAAELRRRIGEGEAGAPPVSIRSNRVLREGSLEVFDRTFAVTAVLRTLAVAVAFIGVLSALLSLQLERSRELGLFRAYGLTPKDLWKLITAETSLLGLVAGLQALPVGIVLAWVMIFVVNKRSFGWTLQMEVPIGLLGQAVGLAVLAALLAGVYPAWRMSRMPPAMALRSE